jgi:hypothetical protein
VDQESPGQVVFFQRSHALPEGSGGIKGDEATDGGDRQGHTGLADRIESIPIKPSAARYPSLPGAEGAPCTPVRFTARGPPQQWNAERMQTDR